VTVYGDGHQVRSNTFIDDCVRATVAALEAPVGEVYNVAGGETANVWEILAKLETILGRRAVVRREPERPGTLRFAGAAPSRIARPLGWRPCVGLDDGLARQVAWQQSAPASREIPEVASAPPGGGEDWCGAGGSGE